MIFFFFWANIRRIKETETVWTLKKLHFREEVKHFSWIYSKIEKQRKLQRCLISGEKKSRICEQTWTKPLWHHTSISESGHSECEALIGISEKSGHFSTVNRILEILEDPGGTEKCVSWVPQHLQETKQPKPEPKPELQDGYHSQNSFVSNRPRVRTCRLQDHPGPSSVAPTEPHTGLLWTVKWTSQPTAEASA